MSKPVESTQQRTDENRRGLLLTMLATTALSASGSTLAQPRNP